MTSSSVNRVSAWYNVNVDFEDSRLAEGRLEFAVTLHIIEQCLQSRSADGFCNVADIGCGTGPYAIELARHGHHVSIADVSAGLVQRAQENARKAQVEMVQAVVCDVRKLREIEGLFRREHYDTVLLLGPLYHILDIEDRKSVLTDVLTMVRPGGHVVAAFVTRNAHLRDVCMRDPARLLHEREFYQVYQRDGRYTRGSGPSMFHSTIKDIRDLVDDVRETTPRFDLVKMVAAEGFLGFRMASNLAKLDDTMFAPWLEVILETAEDETTLGASDHILVVLKRQGEV